MGNFLPSDSSFTFQGRWFIAAIAALLLFGWWFYDRETREIRSRKYSELSAIASVKENALTAWRAERLADARAITSGWVKRGILDLAGSGSDEALKKSILEQFRVLRDEEGYQNILLTDLSGRVLLTLGPSLKAAEQHHRPLIKQAVTSRGPFFGDLYMCRVCGHAHLDIAAPVSGADGRTAAVGILRIDPEKQLYPIIRSWPTGSRTAEALLVRRDGEDVLFLNELRHSTAPALSIRIPASREDLPAAMAVAGRTGVFEGADYRGERVLSDLRAIPGSGWFMITKVDSSEFLSELRFRRSAALSFVLLTLITCGFAALMLHNMRQRRILQELADSRRELDEARDEIRATLYGIGDGVISTDAKGRVARMNQIAERLTGWKESEAKGEPLARVFRIVNEETR
ncbi:MAG TPA: PAS domain-containing protein, partial [Elusimicrobiales bacterium]|nr:PAS domain-containing protein [Elusimicrobiales bacterium]